MSPRPYRLGQRKLATEQTRARIIAAARELLSAETGVAGFTIDAVARQAGVARMTVYYQFNSKRGLLEALFDDLAARGLVARLIPALKEPAPRVALEGLIAAFAGFWASDRLVLRRVRSLAALDPEVEESIRERDGLRRGHLARLLARWEGPLPTDAEALVDILHTLTSFETFDNLAGSSRREEDVAALVLQLARQALSLEAR